MMNDEFHRKGISGLNRQGAKIAKIAKIAQTIAKPSQGESFGEARPALRRIDFGTRAVCF